MSGFFVFWSEWFGYSWNPYSRFLLYFVPLQSGLIEICLLCLIIFFMTEHAVNGNFSTDIPSLTG